MCDLFEMFDIIAPFPTPIEIQPKKLKDWLVAHELLSIILPIFILGVLSLITNVYFLHGNLNYLLVWIPLSVIMSILLILKRYKFENLDQLGYIQVTNKTLRSVVLLIIASSVIFYIFLQIFIFSKLIVFFWVGLLFFAVSGNLTYFILTYITLFLLAIIYNMLRKFRLILIVGVTLLFSLVIYLYSPQLGIITIGLAGVEVPLLGVINSMIHNKNTSKLMLRMVFVSFILFVLSFVMFNPQQVNLTNVLANFLNINVQAIPSYVSGFLNIISTDIFRLLHDFSFAMLFGGFLGLFLAAYVFMEYTTKPSRKSS